MRNHHDWQSLRRIGSSAAVQVAPTRPSVDEHHELVTDPLAVETIAAQVNFIDHGGSTIRRPQVRNVYLGQFWDARPRMEAFSKALVQNGYLDPLKTLGYGSGSGEMMAPIDGPALNAGHQFTDGEAQDVVRKLLSPGGVPGDENSLFMLILPDGAVSSMVDNGQKAQSCLNFCGYHSAARVGNLMIAYAVMPSTMCKGCSGQVAPFDAFTMTYSHEVAEACTDRVPGQGWFVSAPGTPEDGMENADLEAWIPKKWGMHQEHTVQGYYTNEAGNTLGPWRA